jgi:hypothetical protein
VAIITRETVEVNEGDEVKKIHRYADAQGGIIAEILVNPEGIDADLFLKGMNISIKDPEILRQLAAVLKDMCGDKCLGLPSIEKPAKKELIKAASGGLWDND